MAIVRFAKRTICGVGSILAILSRPQYPFPVVGAVQLFDSPNERSLPDLSSRHDVTVAEESPVLLLKIRNEAATGTVLRYYLHATRPVDQMIR